MRKKIFVPLLAIFIVVFAFGRSYANKPMYSREEIIEYNQGLILQQKMGWREEKLQKELQEENQIKPVIQVVYPQGVEDGQTVTADRVYLKFFSLNEIVSVTANGMNVSTLTDTTVTTAGTYKIVVTDDQGNEGIFNFTLNK